MRNLLFALGCMLVAINVAGGEEYIVFALNAEGEGRIISRVAIAEPVTRLVSQDRGASASIANNGAVRPLNVFEVPPIRAEVARPDGQFERVDVAAGESLFVITGNTDGGDSLELRARDGRRALVDLRGHPLAKESPPTAGRVRSLMSPGPVANRVNLVIVGEGYREDEREKFDGDARTLMNNFFNVEPYTSYKPAFDVRTLFVPSSESGADHPRYSPNCTSRDCCRDPEASTDAKAGQMRTTAFDARYCTSDVLRLLTVDSSKVFTAAAATPDWDAIIVVVNDDTYGGAGGPASVASTHFLSVELAKHEFGHSFTDLADEYETPFPSFAKCSDLAGGTRCEPNATDETNRALVKWTAWIEPATPVPTPTTAQYFEPVGLFEGARYLARGFYRPKHDCLMRSLTRPFCEVCREAFVRRVYSGPYRQHPSGLDPIDSVSPRPGNFQTAATAIPFQVSLLPGISESRVTWKRNGEVIAEGASVSIAPRAGRTDTIELGVEDLTPLVRNGREPLASSRTWTIRLLAFVISELSPSAGPRGGGTRVFVKGNSFETVTEVRFGGVLALFRIVDPETLEVTAPAGDGTVDVLLRNRAGESTTFYKAFRYADARQRAPKR